MKKEKFEIVWKDELNVCRVVLYDSDGEFARLVLEIGLPYRDSKFYFQVNLNEFWVALCEYMNKKPKIKI